MPATAGRTRSATLPQLPTFDELGVKQLTLTEAIWLLAPAGQMRAHHAQRGAQIRSFGFSAAL